MTDACVADNQQFDAVLDANNTGKDVWADSAYRSAVIEAKIASKGLRSRVHWRAMRNHPLTPAQENVNGTRSKVRARVAVEPRLRHEHIFGHQNTSMGGKIVRTIGIARATFKIGMMNLGYNISRFTMLQRAAAAPG